MGTSGMDTIAPPDAQNAVYDAASCDKKRYIYVKYIHERINAFEDVFPSHGLSKILLAHAAKRRNPFHIQERPFSRFRQEKGHSFFIFSYISRRICRMISP